MIGPVLTKIRDITETPIKSVITLSLFISYHLFRPNPFTQKDEDFMV